VELQLTTPEVTMVVIPFLILLHQQVAGAVVMGLRVLPPPDKMVALVVVGLTLQPLVQEPQGKVTTVVLVTDKVTVAVAGAVLER
jgi:hypothetical protein